MKRITHSEIYTKFSVISDKKKMVKNRQPEESRLIFLNMTIHCLIIFLDEGI